MKYLFSLIVLLGVLAGCSNSSTKESTATATEPANSSQPAIPEIVPAPPPAVANFRYCTASISYGEYQ